MPMGGIPPPPRDYGRDPASTASSSSATMNNV